MNSVSAVASDGVWMAGSWDNDALVEQTLTEHWDGVAWSIVATPVMTRTTKNLFGTVAAPGRAWAVGQFLDTHGVYRTLIEQWDGLAWSIAPDTAVPGGLSSVAITSARGVWVVGNTGADTLTGHYC